MPKTLPLLGVVLFTRVKSKISLTGTPHSTITNTTSIIPRGETAIHYIYRTSGINQASPDRITTLRCQLRLAWIVSNR
ncbi:hypothetical protein F4779DRAFT_522794 [Xylariaceae sp. FL0662B]|nr:hypothetical protein F4779DRAFT_522794 [Xylariaceae sp. FL0662B]